MSEPTVKNVLPEWSVPGDLKQAATIITNLGRNMHEHAYLVGRTLLWVKKEVGHGKFLKWLEKNVWFRRFCSDQCRLTRWVLGRAAKLLSFLQPTEAGKMLKQIMEQETDGQAR